MAIEARPRRGRARRARHAREECVAQASRSFYQLRPASWSDTGSGVGLGLLEQIAEERLPEYLTAHLREEREQRGRERHERHERHEREQEQAALRAQIRARPAGRRPSNDQADPESTGGDGRGEDRPPSEPAVDSRSC